MGNHDCSKLLSKVFLALDGALTVDEEKQFLDELTQCSWCLEQFNIEKSFKGFLCDKIQKKFVKPEAVAEIKARIRQMALA
ncbi:MAG: hypothetical protein SFW35_03865 [Chitinophagales bacterium]|nr:hypothetical protein [Chitinophagales bacterium]